MNTFCSLIRGIFRRRHDVNVNDDVYVNEEIYESAESVLSWYQCCEFPDLKTQCLIHLNFNANISSEMGVNDDDYIKMLDALTFMSAHECSFDVKKLPTTESRDVLAVLRSLPDLMSHNFESCMERVIPLVFQVLQNADVDQHVEAATAFLALLQGDVVSPAKFTSVFLPYVIGYLEKNDHNIYSAWLPRAVKMIGLLSESDAQGMFLTLASMHSTMESSDNHRGGAALIFGALISHMNSVQVGRDIWPKLQSLSQDVNPYVRSCVCGQMVALFERGSPELAERNLLPCLIDMTNDESVIVRAEAVSTVVKLLSVVTIEHLEKNFIPLVLNVCDKAINVMDKGTRRLAEEFGRLCFSLRNREALSRDLSQDLVNKFLKLCKYDLNYANAYRNRSQFCSTIRVRCIEVLTDVISANYDSKSFQSMLAFSAIDPSTDVRIAIASNFHKIVANVIEKEEVSERVYLDPLKRALKDYLIERDEQVLNGIFSHLSETLKAFHNASSLSEEQVTEISDLMVAAITHMQSSNNWRVLEQLYDGASCIVSMHSSDYIYEKLYPFFFDAMMNAKALSVKYATARIFSKILRYNLLAEQRAIMRERLHYEFCRNTSSRQRTHYIFFCAEARQIFSEHYFSAHFEGRLLSLCNDPVPNIRLLMVKQFLCDMSEDARISVEATMDYMLLKERDEDILEALHRVKAKFSNDDENPESYQERRAQAAIEDTRKLEEERSMLYLKSSAIAKPFELLESDIEQTNQSGSVAEVASSNTPASDTARRASRSSSAVFKQQETTHHSCTCLPRWHKSGAAMEISWLNLESAMKQEVDAHSGTSKRIDTYFGSQNLPHTYKASAIFSSVFEKEFYRDAGVLPDDILYHAPTSCADEKKVALSHQIMRHFEPYEIAQRQEGSYSSLNLCNETFLKSDFPSEHNSLRERFQGKSAFYSKPSSVRTGMDGLLVSRRPASNDFLDDNGKKSVAIFEKKMFGKGSTCTLPSQHTAPRFLAQTRKSKSFVLPTTRLGLARPVDPVFRLVSKATQQNSSEAAPPLKTTRIPVANRRSMDISQWSRRSEERGRGDFATIPSKLPIRKKRGK